MDASVGEVAVILMGLGLVIGVLAAALLLAIAGAIADVARANRDVAAALRKLDPEKRGPIGEYPRVELRAANTISDALHALRQAVRDGIQGIREDARQGIR